MLIQRGQIIELGRHRLMCGDAFSEQDVDALMDGQKPDMLYCDPPYGMNLDTDNSFRAKYAHLQRSSMGATYHAVIGDVQDFDPRPAIERFASTREQFWWGADYYRDRLPAFGSWIVWDKRLKPEIDKQWGSCFELCWSRARHKRDIARVLWSGLLGMRPGGVEGRRFHPTQKPVLLAEWFLERYSKPEAAVADLFAGSGSTLLACDRMNRRAYCMEISPDYCQVIIDRYHALTKQPRLLEVS